MSDDNSVITDFTISDRVNEGISNFEIKFNTPRDPDEYDTGKTFEFVITDNTLAAEFIAVGGIVEKLKRNAKNGNKIYNINGRDKGRLLLKQPFTLDATEEDHVERTVLELLTLILQDTGIIIGRGQQLNSMVTLTTDGTQASRFEGSWSTKKDAINQLFSQYIRFGGAEKFRWYVDTGGYLRWFEINNEREGKLYFFEDDDQVLDFEVEKDATNIINSFTGYYGEEEDQQSVTIENSSSITTYGLCIADPITETNMTESEVTEKLQQECDQKSVPIYTATLTLIGYYDIERGTQLMFPEDSKHSEVTFTVADRRFVGIAGSAQTVLGLSSDESVISIPNEFEVIKATVEREVQNARAVTAIVASVPESGDRFTALLTSGVGSGSTVSARNIGANFVSD